MYDAKDAGRDLRTRRATAEAMGGDLRALCLGEATHRSATLAAADADRFVLHAQPIVDLASGG